MTMGNEAKTSVDKCQDLRNVALASFDDRVEGLSNVELGALLSDSMVSLVERIAERNAKFDGCSAQVGVLAATLAEVYARTK